MITQHLTYIFYISGKKVKTKNSKKKEKVNEKMTIILIEDVNIKSSFYYFFKLLLKMHID